jgi:hypothetical protein
VAAGDANAPSTGSGRRRTIGSGDEPAEQDGEWLARRPRERGTQARAERGARRCGAAGAALFPEVLRSPAFAVLHGRGGDNARHAEQLAEWLAGVDKIGLRRVLYLRDRDELPPSALRTLQGSKTVAMLQRRELENYLLDPAAVAQLLGTLVRDAKLPTVADISAAIADAAENLRDKIIVIRVCRQVQPPRLLMEHRLRRRLAQGRRGPGICHPRRWRSDSEGHGSATGGDPRAPR